MTAEDQPVSAGNPSAPMRHHVEVRPWAVLVAVVTSLLFSGCEEAHGPSVPYTGGPTDGVWQGFVPSNAVSFGQWTPTPTTPGAFDEYIFTINAPPTLSTYDNGKTVTMTSTVTVQRVKDKGFDDGISGQSFLFSPGAYAPENSQNEDYAEDTTLTCPKDRITVGETTTCTISFDAAASEIPNSYWDINQYAVGAWPSQTVR